MAELTSMRNIGAEMARKLTAVGIDTPEKLAEAGSKEAFFCQRRCGFVVFRRTENVEKWRVKVYSL